MLREAAQANLLSRIHLCEVACYKLYNSRPSIDTQIVKKPINMTTVKPVLNLEAEERSALNRTKFYDLPEVITHF